MCYVSGSIFGHTRQPKHLAMKHVFKTVADFFKREWFLMVTICVIGLIIYFFECF